MSLVERLIDQEKQYVATLRNLLSGVRTDAALIERIRIAEWRIKKLSVAA